MHFYSPAQLLTSKIQVGNHANFSHDSKKFSNVLIVTPAFSPLILPFKCTLITPPYFYQFFVFYYLDCHNFAYTL
jgi:hypothetical protein